MTSTVSVHRCRFVDYTPTAITAIAFPPPPSPSTLALGRANGNIELHQWSGAAQALQAWVLQKVLPAPVPSKVDCLVFTTRPRRTAHLRLFSAGGGSEILEWNLEDGTILRSISSQAGSVWSMAANPSSTLLALGCEDGSVRIISLADDSLIHHRRFDRVKARLLSIAWGPPVRRRPAPQTESSSEDDDESNRWVDTWLAVGCSDSSLRKYDVASGRVLDRMSTDKAKGESTLVWAIGVLGDGTIVSGDSLGNVAFWDSITCTQLQTFRPHNADVLCLAIGPEGMSVYTSGVDQKVCQFSNVQVSNATEGASHKQWIHASSRRLHSHDVRALALWPPYTPIPTHNSSRIHSSTSMAPLLVSGGLDMSFVVSPCSLPSGSSPNIINPVHHSHITTFEDAYHLRVPYSTGMSPAVQVAREAKLVLCRRDTGLTLWKITRSVSPGEVGLIDLESLGNQRGDDWEIVADMELKVRTNLVASTISSNGRWVAASDLYETKLFRLLHSEGEIQPRRVKLSGGLAGATSLLFTADSSKLILGASMGTALVVVMDLTEEGGDSPCILRKFEHHKMRNVFVGANPEWSSETDPGIAGDADDADESIDAEVIMPRSRHQSEPSASSTVTCMAASLDGQWLASADTQHRIRVFNLDSVQHHCALPSFPHAIVALAFDPVTPSTLAIGLANNTLQVFDVEARQFPSLYQGLPSSLSQLHEPLLGIAFDPTSEDPRRALVWGSSWMCKVDLTAPTGLGWSSKKRRRGSTHHALTAADSGSPADSDLKVVKRYRPMLLVDFFGPGELVVIERPLVDLLSALPPAFFKPSYGS